MCDPSAEVDGTCTVAELKFGRNATIETYPGACDLRFHLRALLSFLDSCTIVQGLDQRTLVNTVLTQFNPHYIVSFLALNRHPTVATIPQVLNLSDTGITVEFYLEGLLPRQSMRQPISGAWSEFEIQNRRSSTEDHHRV